MFLSPDFATELLCGLETSHASGSSSVQLDSNTLLAGEVKSES